MLKMFYDEEKGTTNPRIKKPGSLDLFDEPEMEQFFTAGIRGGQSFIATRHAKGNADPRLPGDHLLYVDANNLYGSMETFKLPVGNFEWVPEENLKSCTARDILKLPTQGDIGYAFEVDLEYPKKYHARDDQFPLAPYNGKLSFKDLSPYNRSLLKKHYPRDYKKRRYVAKKLLATFHKRRRYVVLLDNLQYYLKRGMKLIKVRRAIKFTQRDFLKKFITKITKLRSEAKTDFELRLFKLFANSTFGKFIGEESSVFFVARQNNNKLL